MSQKFKKLNELISILLWRFFPEDLIYYSVRKPSNYFEENFLPTFGEIKSFDFYMNYRDYHFIVPICSTANWNAVRHNMEVKYWPYTEKRPIIMCTVFTLSLWVAFLRRTNISRACIFVHPVYGVYLGPPSQPRVPQPPPPLPPTAAPSKGALL